MKFTISDPKFNELVSEEMKSGIITPERARFEFSGFMKNVSEYNLVRSNKEYSNVADFLNLVYAYAEKIYGEGSIHSENPYRGYVVMNLIDHYVTPNLIKMRVETMSILINLLHPEYSLIRDYLNGLVREYFTPEGYLERIDKRNLNRIQNGIMKLVRVVINEYRSNLRVFSEFGSGTAIRTEVVVGYDTPLVKSAERQKRSKKMLIDYDHNFVVGISDRFNLHVVLLRDVITNSPLWSEYPISITILTEWWNELIEIYGHHAAAEIMLAVIVSNHTPVPPRFIHTIAYDIGDDCRALIPTSQQYYKPKSGYLLFDLIRFNETNQFDEDTLNELLTICYHYETFGIFRSATFDEFVEDFHSSTKRFKPLPAPIVANCAPAKEFSELNIGGVTTGLFKNKRYINAIDIF